MRLWRLLVRGKRRRLQFRPVPYVSVELFSVFSSAAFCAAVPPVSKKAKTHLVFMGASVAFILAEYILHGDRRRPLYGKFILHGGSLSTACLFHKSSVVGKRSFDCFRNPVWCFEWHTIRNAHGRQCDCSGQKRKTNSIPGDMFHSRRSRNLHWALSAAQFVGCFQAAENGDRFSAAWA